MNCMQPAKLTSRVEILNIRICAFVSASCVYNFRFRTSASSCNQAANFIFRSGFVGSYLNNKPLLRSSAGMSACIIYLLLSSIT